MEIKVKTQNTAFGMSYTVSKNLNRMTKVTAEFQKNDAAIKNQSKGLVAYYKWGEDGRLECHVFETKKKFFKTHPQLKLAIEGLKNNLLLGGFYLQRVGHSNTKISESFSKNPSLNHLVKTRKENANNEAKEILEAETLPLKLLQRAKNDYKDVMHNVYNWNFIKANNKKQNSYKVADNVKYTDPKVIADFVKNDAKLRLESKGFNVIFQNKVLADEDKLECYVFNKNNMVFKNHPEWETFLYKIFGVTNSKKFGFSSAEIGEDCNDITKNLLVQAKQNYEEKSLNNLVLVG